MAAIASVDDKKTADTTSNASVSTSVALPASRISQLIGYIPLPFETATLINNIMTTNLVPDRLVRHAMRWMLWDRTREYTTRSIEAQMEYKQAFIKQLKGMPIAIVPEKANEQHYEVPSNFYQLCLGKHLKYSCCLYEKPTSTLEEAERAMLDLYVQRAGIVDGMSILDLGCGWGSFSLYAAGRFPAAKITAVSNSNTQREYIEGQAKKLGFNNLKVITCDVNKLTSEILGVTPAGSISAAVSATINAITATPKKKESGKAGKKAAAAATATTTSDESSDESKEVKSAGGIGNLVGGFDRVISIEMFEHMKNYEKLFAQVASWVKPDTGRVFVHIFTSKDAPYHFEGDNWMARYFFAGGTMPSDDLFAYFQRDLQIVDQWRVNGKHYARTSRDWLRRMDNNAKQIKQLFADTYGGPKEGKRWWVMWRVFYLAVEEMFAYDNGNQWMVSHYLFSRPSRSSVPSLTASA